MYLYLILLLFFFFFIPNKVASELNAAILRAQNQEETTPLLAELLKLLLWAQDELNKKKVQYPVMTDLNKGQIEEPK